MPIETKREREDQELLGLKIQNPYFVNLNFEKERERRWKEEKRTRRKEKERRREEKKEEKKKRKEEKKRRERNHTIEGASIPKDHKPIIIIKKKKEKE